MSRDINKFKKGLGLTPETSINIDQKGELQVDDTSGKLNYHDGAGTSPLVTETSTATLTNKTIDGDSNTIQDLGLGTLKTELTDANKVIRRDAAGAVVADNAIPNSSELVTTDASQTLTGKTIDGDDNTVQDLTLASLKTDLANADKVLRRDSAGAVISGNNLPNTSDLVTTDSSQTLTNKTIDGDNNTIQDLGLGTLKTELADADKVIRRNASGAVISGNAIPNTSNLVTIDASQAISNKDIDGGTASNTNRITLPKAAKATLDALTRKEGTLVYDTDADKVLYDDGAILKELGSGSGTAGTTYFSDRNAENIANFVLYSDGGATPTDGIGGTPNITKALNTSTPLIGLSSYRISHPGTSSRQGQGVSFTTDIPLDAPVTAGEPITVQFRYRTSANYASNEVRMFVYFVGPNSLQALNGVSNTGEFGNNLVKSFDNRSQFTASTSCPAGTTAIRVIAHIAGSGTAAWDLDIDEITIGTAATLTAPIVTDWVPYTPPVAVGSGSITNFVASGFWKREGDDIIVKGTIRFTGASGTWSGGLFVGLPSPFTVDYSKVKQREASTKMQRTGTFDITTASYNAVRGTLVFADFLPVNPNTSFGFNVFSVNTSDAGSPADPVFNQGSGYLSNTVIGTTVNDNFITWDDVRIPVTQFTQGSNVISSTQANFISGALRANRTGAANLAPNTTAVKVPYNTVAGSLSYQIGGLTFDTTNSRFVATKRVLLRLSASLGVTGSNTLNNLYYLRAVVNGSSVRASGSAVFPVATAPFLATIDSPILLNAGDFLEVFLFGNGNNSTNQLSIDTTEGFTYFTATEIPDLSVVGISGAPLEIISLVGANTTPTVNDRWHAPTGITLTPGIWKVSYNANFTSNPTNAQYTTLQGNAPGGTLLADATNPAALPSGVSFLDNANSTFLTQWNSNSQVYQPPCFVVVSVLTTATLYPQYRIFASTIAQARLTVRVSAERIR